MKTIAALVIAALVLAYASAPKKQSGGAVQFMSRPSTPKPPAPAPDVVKEPDILELVKIERKPELPLPVERVDPSLSPPAPSFQQPRQERQQRRGLFRGRLFRRGG